MKKWMAILGLAAVVSLSGCGQSAAPTESNEAGGAANGQAMEGMHHTSEGKLPEGLKEAAKPAFEKGAAVILRDGHMAGMEGAKGTVVGAFDTIAYAVTYTPTSGGEKVENHKWVIQEEIQGAGDVPLQPGAKVTLEADHMAGMQGAEAVIDSANPTTVYMVDYVPAAGGAPVKNHQWMTEDELESAAE
ncbi:DUF1541 domain-containing protein [Paenibacillus aurantiacus]|uniref:DUF1541 domain-containing protein n=1 Tax=Paenibacillus aurantiacus TaxID=1936118 RepID=A0ABV5KLU8_9BACL